MSILKSMSLLISRTPQVISYSSNLERGAREVDLIRYTSNFLLHRYLGYDSVLSNLSDSIEAYGNSGTGDVSKFIADFMFPFTVESIRADATNNIVKVEYDINNLSTLYSELLYFDGTQIRFIQSFYAGCSPESLLPRINVCGGAASIHSIKALKSCRLLNLAAQFLHADVTQNLLQQRSLLADDAAAFGVSGCDEIIRVQQEGIAAGTTYTVPFPIQVDTEASCITLDFLAHRGEESQRGTDIMYLDLREDKVVRIDTLRHTLSQPDWVRKHFS